MKQTIADNKNKTPITKSNILDACVLAFVCVCECVVNVCFSLLPFNGISFINTQTVTLLLRVLCDLCVLWLQLFASKNSSQLSLPANAQTLIQIRRDSSRMCLHTSHAHYQKMQQNELFREFIKTENVPTTHIFTKETRRDSNVQVDS